MAKLTRAATHSMTRKQFIRASGGALAATSLLGGGAFGPAATAQSNGITIPDSGAQLPEEEVTLRILNTVTPAPYWDAFASAYSEKYPNISVESDAFGVVEIEEIVSLGLRGESVPDVFYYNQDASIGQAVSEGWLAPLDDWIPDFDAWKAAFPENTFLEGVHMVDGRLYILPAITPRRATNLLLFNRPLMEEAGYDPSAELLSIDEYRDAARRITEQGNGQVYGVIIETQPNRMALWIADLAERAGAVSVEGISPETGEYVYTSDEYLAAIEALMALKSDGSLFPESPPRALQAWPRLPAGNAAMVTAGAWVVDLYNRESPDFNYGVGVHPVLDKTNPLPQSYPADLREEPYCIYEGSELKEVAGDTLGFLGSLAGQEAWGRITGGIGLPPILPEAMEIVRQQTNQQGRRTLEITEDIVATPAPIVRNPDVALVYQEMQALSPNLGETIAAIFVGEADDPAAAMQDLKDRSEAELDRAIAAARELGAEVSREDWVFPNWDPTRDYTQDDYDAL